LTTLMTTELPEGGERLSADGVSEFIADGVILLHYLGIGSAENRSALIRKMRYTSHQKEIMLYDIIESGIILREEETI